MYIYMYVYIYIYIYICVCVCVYIYIYIYVSYILCELYLPSSGLTCSKDGLSRNTSPLTATWAQRIGTLLMRQETTN